MLKLDFRDQRRQTFGRYYKKNRPALLRQYAKYQKTQKAKVRARRVVKKTEKPVVLGVISIKAWKLRCRDCKMIFLSRKGRSNYPPSFCEPCKLTRIRFSKHNHDKKRRRVR